MNLNPVAAWILEIVLGLFPLIVSVGLRLSGLVGETEPAVRSSELFVLGFIMAVNTFLALIRTEKHASMSFDQLFPALAFVATFIGTLGVTVMMALSLAFDNISIGLALFIVVFVVLSSGIVRHCYVWYSPPRCIVPEQPTNTS